MLRLLRDHLQVQFTMFKVSGVRLLVCYCIKFSSRGCIASSSSSNPLTAMSQQMSPITSGKNLEKERNLKITNIKFPKKKEYNNNKLLTIGQNLNEYCHGKFSRDGSTQQPKGFKVKCHLISFDIILHRGGIHAAKHLRVQWWKW